MIISTHEIALLEAGRARHDSLELLHRSGRDDAEKLQRLVGQRCKKFNRLYEITYISYGWNGYISARGYRILKGGVRGTKVWDIGPITAKAFEDG
jgi:hypothetical protein